MQDLNFLSSILVFLFASILVVVLLCKFKLSPVLGYLMVGAMLSHYDWIKLKCLNYHENAPLCNSFQLSLKVLVGSAGRCGSGFHSNDARGW